jgi:hypothetical protein
MKRINLPIIGDTLFAALCSFLLFFTLVRYYTKNAAIALTFAIFAFFIFGALAFMYISGRQQKKLLSVGEEKEKNNLSLYLKFADKGLILQIFSKALQGKIDGGSVVCDDTVYYFNFSLTPLSLDDIAGVIADKQGKNKILLCNKISGDAMQFACDFQVKIMCAEEVYSLLKKADLLPESYDYIPLSKPNILKKITSRLNRKRCAPLFWCGFSLLFFSFFTFFPLYYIIAGSIVLALSAICLIFGKRG